VEGPIKAKFILVLITLAILCAPAFGQTTAKDWVEKGIALTLAGKYNESIAAFDKAVELNPQYADAWYN
jgi:tetratricopeptide (TPR) repeat protein